MIVSLIYQMQVLGKWGSQEMGHLDGQKPKHASLQFLTPAWELSFVYCSSLCRTKITLWCNRCQGEWGDFEYLLMPPYVPLGFKYSLLVFAAENYFISFIQNKIVRWLIFSWEMGVSQENDLPFGHFSQFMDCTSLQGLNTIWMID